MVLTATEHGYGKCTVIEDYRVQGRGGKGLISIQTNDRNGGVVGALMVTQADEIMLITNGGTLVRTRVSEVSVSGRNTLGVRLIRLSEGEQLIGLQRVVESENGYGDSSDDEFGGDAGDEASPSMNEGADHGVGEGGEE